MRVLKFIFKLMATYITFVGALWGLLEGYTYFQGDALKVLLGDYWSVFYLLPLPFALKAATVWNQSTPSTTPINNEQTTNIEGGSNKITNVQGETVHVYVNDEGKLIDSIESKGDSLVINLDLPQKTGLGSSLLVTVTNRHSKYITIRDVSLILNDDNNDEVSVSYMNLRSRHPQLPTDLPIKLGESDSCEFLFPIYFIRLQREDQQYVSPQVTRVLISDTYGKVHAFPPDELDIPTDFQSLQREFRDLWINNVSSAETSHGLDLLDHNPTTTVYGVKQAPADFVGREDELAELTSAINRDRKKGVIITGMGGIGKTALAQALVHQLARYFQDGQIELNLRGTDSIPRPAADVMSSVIHQFDRQSSSPEDIEQLITQYQSCLHNRKVLLLMDNAANAEQLDKLRPPPTCVLIATTRQQFTLPGFANIDLPTLSPSYAKSFLLELAPRIDNHADTIAKLCGQLPLALRLAGSTLKVRQDLPVENYIRRLSDTNNRLKELDVGRKLTHEELGMEASLTLSYQLLADEQLQESWCALAVFPDTFDASAAKSVWDIAMNEVQDILGDLGYYSLIEYDLGTTRYRLHDLARIFAASFLSEDQQLTYQKHHAVHFRDVLQKANKLYREGHESQRLGIDLFDLEWENIRTGFEWASEHAKSDDEIAKICSSYPDVGTNLIPIRLFPNERIHWREAALLAAQQVGDFLSAGKHLGNLAVAYYALGDVHRAIDLNKQALEIYRDHGFRHGEADALGNLANNYSHLGNSKKAIDLLKKSLKIDREIDNNPIKIGHSLNNLGVQYEKLSDLSHAITYYEQALDIYRENGHRLGESLATGNLGSAYYKLKDYEQAKNLFEKQLRLADEIGALTSKANALRDSGTVNCALGNYDHALELLEQSLILYDQTGYRSGKAMALGSIGETYEAKGDLASAGNYYEQAAKLAREIGAVSREIQQFNKLSLALYKLGDIARAKEYAQLALNAFEQVKDKKLKSALEEIAIKIRKRLAKWNNPKV